MTLSILRLCCDINLLLCICFRKIIIINMAAGSSPQQHRLSTGIFASKLCSGGWNPGSSGKPRKNGSFVRKSGFPQTNHSWIAVVFKMLLIILVVLFQSNLVKVVDEPSKSKENTPEKMEVVENSIDERKKTQNCHTKMTSGPPPTKTARSSTSGTS